MLAILAVVPLHAEEAPPTSSELLPSAAPTEIDRRIELRWKSNSPRRWAGTLQWVQRDAADLDPPARPPTAAQISEPVNLTAGPIQSGSIFPTDQGGLMFGPPARLLMLPRGEGKLTRLLTSEGGISFRIRAGAADRLVLRFENDHDSAGWTTEIPIADLVAGQSIEKTIDDQASIWIGRLSGDPLRVRLGSGGTVLWTGEVVDVTVHSDIDDEPDAGDSQWVLECLTYAASDQRLIGTEVWLGKMVEGRLTFDKPQWTAPTIEGAYRVRWQLRAKSPARGSLTHGLSPMALATSLTQSISDAMPTSFSPPFQLPSGPSLSLLGSTEHTPFAQSEFSIAVVAEQLPATEESSAAASDRTAPWRGIGKAEPRDAALSVSRLLPRQTSDWLATASVNPGARAPSHAGKRLTVLDPGAELEYAVPLAQVGRRHRALIRVPASVAMQLAVEVLDGTSEAAGSARLMPLGPGLVIARSDFNGDRQPWHVASIDFWPRSLNTRIRLANLSPDQAASFESIEIQVAEHDPAKRLSVTDDPPVVRLAVMQLELSDFLHQFGDSGTPTLENPLDYQAVWIAGNRLIETLIREGYGGAVLTVSSDGATCYPSELALADASWNANWASAGGPVDALELLLRLFDRASLTLVPCIRPSSPLLALEQAILRDGASHAAIAAPSPLGGQMGNWSFDGPSITAFGIYDPTHPAVAEQVGALFGELKKRCENHRCVAQIGVLADERSYLRLPPITVHDPHTLDVFHTSLGASAPPRAGLTHWIQNGGGAAFEQWRAKRAEAPFQQILQRLDHHTLLVMSLDSALPSHLVALGRDRRIQTARLHRRSLIEPLGLRIRDEACNASVSIDVGSPASPWSHDVGVFHQPLTEIRPVDPAAVDAPSGNRDEEPTWRHSRALTPLLDEAESSLAPAQLLGRSDRMIIAVGGGAMNQPGSEVRRRSLRCFSQLPPVAMADVLSQSSSSSAVRVRQVRYQGDTYIYAVNQTRWPIAVDMTFTRSAAVVSLGQEQIVGLEQVDADPMTFAGAPSSWRRQMSAAARWNPKLAVGELLAIRIKGEDIEIVNWQASFAGEEEQLRLIRSYVQDAVASLAKLVNPAKLELIQNADFEQDAAQGIPGWLTAQYPPECVAVDSSVAFRGNQSVRLTGQAGHAGGSWIVSQVIAPPKSARLAVSARFRGEANASTGALPPLVVRMALEGTVGGTPIRKTKSITVPRDGNWMEPAERLEIVLLPSVPVESLRLTIDLMSAGVVWVDEVSLFDQFMTDGEKTHLDHLVFLAAGGAARSDWTAVSRLLDSHWSLHLTKTRSGNKAGKPFQSAGDRYTTQVGHQVTQDSAGGAEGPPRHDRRKSSPAEPSRPGIGERLKSWLPRPVRF